MTAPALGNTVTVIEPVLKAFLVEIPEMEQEKVLCYMEIVPLHPMETGAPYTWPRHHRRFGVPCTYLGVVPLIEERYIIGYITLFSQFLAEIEPERRQTGGKPLLRKVFGQGHSCPGIRDDEFVGIDAYHYVITARKQPGRLLRKELEPPLLRLYYLRAYLLVEEGVGAVTERRDDLVSAVEIYVKMLLSQLRTVVLHPLPQEEVIIAHHGQGTYLFYRLSHRLTKIRNFQYICGMKEFWQVLKRFAAPYKGYLVGSVVLNFLSAVFNVFSFSLIVPILNILFKMDNTVYTFIEWDTPDVATKEKVMNNLYFYVTQAIDTYGASTTLLWLGVFLIGMTLLKCSCYFASSAVMVPLRTGVVRDLRTSVYDKVLSLPLGYFSSERKGDIIARMSGDVNEVENSITSTLDMLIKNPILIICYFGVLIWVSWQLTLFTLCVVPLMAWAISAVGKSLKRESLEAQNKWSDTMSQFDETLGGLRIIKAFIAERKMQNKFLSTANEFRRATNKVSVRQSSAHPMSEFLGTAMVMIVLWFGGMLILEGRSTFDAPTFIFYMVILYSVLQPLKDFTRAGYMIPRGLASVERIDKILNAGNPIIEKPDAASVRSFGDAIRFNDVHFAYDGSREILHGIDLTIPKGRTIAIVGQSGSGKSTLVDLIPRFHDVTQGSITIDGLDIRDMKMSGLRGMIGNVNQEAILFNDTIFNNIAFGVENADQASVEAAAKVANAHDFIMEMPDGYQTNIGDRGGKLSGGQRQRISIARAILKNPEILILDEATSALDTESERLVQEALDRLTSTRTTIAIAHRLSTIKGADEIVVLHEGRIVERGRHDELLQKDGYYKKLNDMQAL